MNLMSRLRLHAVRDHVRAARVFLLSDDDLVASAEASAEDIHAHFGIRMGSDSTLSFQFAPLVWLSVKVRIPTALHDAVSGLVQRSLQWDDDADEYIEDDDIHIVSIDVHDQSVWWSFLHPASAFCGATPRWRHGHFNVVDAVLGKETLQHDLVYERDIDIQMPEGAYRWKSKAIRVTSTRPRGRTHTFMRYELDGGYDERIPYIGNSCCGFGVQAATEQQAVSILIRSILEDRGQNWSYCAGGKYDVENTTN